MTRHYTRSLPGSASNQLYHNEVAGFASAMTLIIRMCREERIAEPTETSDPNQGVLVMRLNEDLEMYAEMARLCRREYRMHAGPVDDLCQRWEESCFPQVRDIGRALRSGNYSDLSI